MNKIFSLEKLGNIKLEGHILHPKSDYEKVKYAFVALGQGGGKLALEFNRVGHYVTLFNTAKEDLMDAEAKLQNINNGNYKTTRFSGFDGAKKDRNIGIKAVRENLDVIQNHLVDDKRLEEADFVWVVAAFGGGTGSGAVTDVVRIVSSIIRNGDKRLGYEEDDEEYILNEGKPTVGVIAIIPDDSSGHRIKLNAAEALQELSALQDEGLLGSILIVDNEKLIKTALSDNGIDSNLKWHVKGNASVVSLLTEVTITSSIPSEESFDKSELLDVFSEPGYLSFTKHVIYERQENDIDKIAENSFSSQIFADGFDNKDATLSAMLLVKKENTTLFSPKDELLLRAKVNEIMCNTRYIHYGIYDVQTTIEYDEVIKSIGDRSLLKNEKILIYTLSVLKNPPKRVIEMTNDAIAKKNESEKLLSSSENKLTSIDLGTDVKQQIKKKNDQTLDALFASNKTSKKKNDVPNLEELITLRKKA